MEYLQSSTDKRLQRSVTWFVVIVLSFIIVTGVVMVTFPVKPFWLDEWSVIWNLKFKTSAALWGKLEYAQQFPRLYLEGIKQFTRAFDYSYASLHFPAFFVHVLALVFCWKLSSRIFPDAWRARMLMVIIYASFRTSIHYFVQVKQYTMEMMLALLAIWQLMELLKAGALSGRKYAVLCASLIIAPFLSYTYPIAIAPAFALVIFWQAHEKAPLKNFLPILLGSLAIAAFFWLDVRHVLHDGAMQDYWKDYLLKGDDKTETFFINIYKLFATLGTGDFFEIIYGIAGLSALLFCTSKLRHLLLLRHSVQGAVVAYSALLVWLCIGLFLAGKLPLGTHRLNAFMVPAIAVMTGYFLSAASFPRWGRMLSSGLATALILLSGTGACFSLAGDLTDAAHARNLRIYNNTGRAIALAQHYHLPLLATPGVGYPYAAIVQGDYIVKTNPAYHVEEALPVYPIKRPEAADSLLGAISGAKGAAIITTGDSTWILR